MEVSPAKSLDVVSDSEGEEDTRDELDLLERELNAARFAGPRDWDSTSNAATIATNTSSHISQFSTPLPGQPFAMATDSSAIQTTSDMSATKPRSRPRPRMRPVPPPDDVGSSSIDAFPTLPPMTGGGSTTIASFGNSAVQGVPAARPPSLPPSSLPGTDSSSIPAPTFPVPSPPKARPKPRSAAPPQDAPIPSSSIVPGTAGADQPAPSAPKRPRPKMRPPPPPEPEATPATTYSAATASSSTNANAGTSTAATTTSSAEAARRSALDDAEEYTGRGARRLGQPVKSLALPELDLDVDVGGPEDVINLLDSSDGEFSKAKAPPKPKAKAKPKPKKQDASKAGSTPAQSEALSGTNAKRKSPQLPTSDDEFGRWDTVIPGSSGPSNTKSRKRKKTGIPLSDDEDVSSNRPTTPAHVPNTIAPPPVGPPSSPLTDPGRSPETKRRGPPESAPGEASIPSPAKKARKSSGNVLVGVVLQAPPNSDDAGKKTKAKRKRPTKAAAEDVSSTLGRQDPAIGDEQAYVPQALSSTVDTSSSGLHSEPSKTKSTPPTSSGASLPVQPPTGDLEPARDPAPVDVEPAPAASTKKQPKKRAPKAKKGAATEEPAPTDEQETPAPKKAAKGKKKSKAAEPPTDAATDDATNSTPVASSSNPDAGVAASSSNPSAGAAPTPVLSNSAAPNQTPVPKAKAKPRQSATPASLPVAMGASGSLLRSTGGKSSERPLSETIRRAIGSSTPTPRVGLSRRGSSKIAPLLAFRGVPPPPPPPMPKKPVRKKKGQSDDEDSEEGSEWEGLTEKQKEKKRKEKEMAGWYSD